MSCVGFRKSIKGSKFWSVPAQGPVSRRFRKVFGPGKPQQKSQTLSLQSCSFHIFLMWTNFPFMQSFMPIHFFVFNIRTIENGFADPKRFRDFRETGPRSQKSPAVHPSNKPQSDMLLSKDNKKNIQFPLKTVQFCSKKIAVHALFAIVAESTWEIMCNKTTATCCPIWK